MRNIFTLAAGSVFVLLASGHAHADTLRLSDMESLTGVASAVYVPQANAVQLAGEQINAAGGVTIGGVNYTLQIDQYDDRTDTSAGVATVQKILGLGAPSFIMGGGTSSISAAYSPIIKDRTDVIVMVTASLLPGLTDNPSIYRPRVTSKQYTDSIVSFVTGNPEFKRVALGVDNKNAGLVNEVPALKAGLLAAGVEIVAEEEWGSGNPQFATQIAAMSRNNPDVLVLRGYPADVARLVKQARELGYSGPIVTNSGMSATDVENAQAAESMDGVVEVVAPVVSDLIAGDLNKEAAQKFEDAYQARFGTPSGLLSVSAYDAVFILTRAMEHAGTTTDVPAIKAALDVLKVSDVPEAVTPIKPYDGDLLFKDRQAQFVTVVRQWKDGKFVPLTFVK
ncbi:hypothetical protein LL06_03525 [Hoeflea sp. BAL378]|uniref:ABC transporter substrate-binding protein n=1 Tax=Hoeflea sp. BAL378 TaxID=1547437 RepID=UPI000513A24A|nr:ABC transporter substrate-binding protein [Hoeflea sp. BAL378]KGF70720.1 hypothetical protein LL06_03525 [Hoeflea sp. BAL378]